MLPAGKGVTYITKHEHLTGQDVADKEMPGSVTQPLVDELKPEKLAKFDDSVPSLEQKITGSRREENEEDLVIHKPASPRGITARRGRPRGSKNQAPVPHVEASLEASDDSEDGAPVARRTRSHAKTQQVSLVTLSDDPNYGIWLEF